MALRAGRAGDALELEMKLQRRYEQEEELGVPQRIVDWIIKIVGVEVKAPNAVYDYRTIHSLLKDGSVLCKLMNKLLEHVGLAKVSYRSTVKSSFVAIANIDNFCVAARNYGVPANCLFQSSDLYEGRKSQMLSVLNCLNQLGKIANTRGFPQVYEAIPPPKPDQD